MTQKTAIYRMAWARWSVAAVVVMAAAATYSVWWPRLSGWIDSTLHTAASAEDGTQDPAHEAAGQASESLTLTPQARLNLGLTDEFVQPVQLSDYDRSISVPAVIAPKPGRSKIVVASPLSGVVTHVHAVTGEAVMPGELLFEIRLTYEDLVETQTRYLQTISELAVEQREILRLESATRTGAISGKALLERRYAKEKLEAALSTQREALRLHGLSDRQVDAIGRNGKLLGNLRVVAPDIDRHEHGDDDELRLSQNPYRPVAYGVSSDESPVDEAPKPLVVDELMVHKGQSVTAGEQLCSLSDYTQLYIEGKAFEQDIGAIALAAERQWPVKALFPGADGSKTSGDLQIAYVGNAIDSSSRTLSFFVDLPNRMVRDTVTPQGQRYISWDYRVGQRLEIQITVEQWENQIVVPVEALAKEGADWFMFQQNGKRFDRVPVHVRHRDPNFAVIANDGSLFPGDVIALKSAHRMQMAIKNSSGGAPDPHAGHTH